MSRWFVEGSWPATLQHYVMSRGQIAHTKTFPVILTGGITDTCRFLPFLFGYGFPFGAVTNVDNNFIRHSQFLGGISRDG